MSDDTNTPAEQEAAEAEVEKFRDQLGPFVVAAEKTRMAMLFTNAKEDENAIVFANDAFLQLTGFGREEVLGASFKSLMARGTGSEAVAEIETAFAGRADSEPEICYRRKDGTDFWASIFISPVCNEAGDIEQHFISIVDHTAQREKQAHCEMLIDELNHRVKNTLSTVQSIARQALRASADPNVIRESIESRIFALSRSHDLLTHENWEGAGLHDLIEAALKPFGIANGNAERFRIEGKNIRLLPKATLALGIALHELATNAVKYGLCQRCGHDPDFVDCRATAVGRAARPHMARKGRTRRRAAGAQGLRLPGGRTGIGTRTPRRCASRVSTRRCFVHNRHSCSGESRE